MKLPTTLVALIILTILTMGTPLSAQTTSPDPDGLSIKPFAMIAAERFSAATTFDAIFGQSIGTLFGGGVRVTRRRLFVEVRPRDSNAPASAVSRPTVRASGWRLR